MIKAQYETQLTYRRLDENGDMIFGQSNTGFIDGLEAMTQVLKTRLGSVAGEWWEGDDGALPFFAEILGSRATSAQRETVDLMVIDRIMDTVGVIGVSDVESSIYDRSYNFKCTVKTVYGETTAEVNT